MVHVLKSSRALCPCVSSFLSALCSPRLGKRELVCVLLVYLFVCFVCVRLCHFSIPLGVGGWLRVVIVALLGLFCSRFCNIRFTEKCVRDCNSLNAHLYRNNIEPSPSCSCGVFESTYLCLFKCPNFSLIIRRYLPNNPNELNTNELLYGLPNAFETENELFLSQVQDFILHSKRFV